MNGVNDRAPLPWLEGVLRWCLPPRDRETVSGDLLEEYRETQLPQLGPVWANIWYLRQLFGFLAVRSFGGSAMKSTLTWMCVATTLAGAWLAVMETVLKHPGFAGRSTIAACIVIQGIATVLCLMLHGRSIFRLLVLAGAVGIAVLGAAAVIRILNAAHFEGFVLVIGAMLVVQGVLALVVVGGGTTRRPGIAA
ncbi:MAG TPA: hypothetical protein VGV09_06575 [Steroidobacteraceae bacterium]|nr:hypothetical protein [Steroidobacteraceae bacterium]